MKRTSTKSYFGLERHKIYSCNLDTSPLKHFEYKLHKHYLVYREVGTKEWRGVWNSEWYNDSKASYTEKKR